MLKVLILVVTSLFSIVALFRTFLSRKATSMQQGTSLSRRVRETKQISPTEASQSPMQEHFAASGTTPLRISSTMQHCLIEALSEHVQRNFPGHWVFHIGTEKVAAERKQPRRESFEVELIKNSKYHQDSGKVLYEIKWRGYSDNENTWEPRENLLP